MSVYLSIDLQKSQTDATNFDKDFTSEEPQLTPIDPVVISAINQEEFQGFTFVNEEFGKLFQTSQTTTVNGSPSSPELPTDTISPQPQQQQQQQLSNQQNLQSSNNNHQAPPPPASVDKQQATPAASL